MNTLNDSLTAFDPDIAALIDGELRRQESGLEMIASENYAPLAVMQAQGSVLTNKYAEGYPGRRYYGGVAEAARTHRPKMIIAGWSAYPRQLDFARFRAIADEVDAVLMVDMAHFAGLVAAGVHPSPVPHAHVVTSTTHKTLGGPRGGIILCNDPAIAKKINSAVFPGQQGGPLEHVVAAKATAFKMAAQPEFAQRQQRCLDGARILAGRLTQPDVAERGIAVLTGGTDVHLVLVDLRDAELDGQQAEDRLAAVDITVNRNAVPFDPRPPMITSGLRIGTPALAARGFSHNDFRAVADLIAAALTATNDDQLGPLRAQVQRLAARYPLYPELHRT